MMKRNKIRVLIWTLLLGPLALATVSAVPLSEEKATDYPMTLTELRSAFGGAIVIGSHEIFVGEAQGFKDPGTVHVFQRTIDGLWSRVAGLRGPNPAVGDQFGQALAVSGDVLAVGSTHPNKNKGAIFVYRRNAETGGWAYEATLAASDGAEGDGLGAVVVSTENQILAAAPQHADKAGAVYVFSYDATLKSWSPSGKLTATALAADARLGSAMAIAGDRLLVGAPNQGDGGAVYVYQQERGAWREAGMLMEAEGTAGASFGVSVAVQGDWAMVGAPRIDRFTGAVFAFQWANGAWQQRAKLIPTGMEGRNFFGATVLLNGTELWANAPLANSFAGGLFRFAQQADGSWTDAPALEAEEIKSGDFFAGAFAVQGDLAVIGATGDDYGEGTARIFGRDASGQWAEQMRIYNPLDGFAPVADGQVDCADGEAAAFKCQQIDMVSFMPNADMGMNRGVRMNDVWGWTDTDTGREYAIAGHLEGSVFVDLTDPFNPIYLGTLPRTEGTPGSTWRDMKVYQNHVYIVADGAGEHGMQVFDLTELRNFDGTPKTYEAHAHYDIIHSAHNIFINEASGFAYVIGASGGGNTCGGGLHMIDLKDPKDPSFVGCFADKSTGNQQTGYSHDVHCVMYNGPDATYQGREICIGANETAISIADVTDKQDPKAIATGSYPDHSYVHQGWLSEDHRYFYQNDELDELNGKVDRTRTLIWDVTDLDDPQLVKQYFGPTSATDHNLYIQGNLMYQTNNASGLRILDISDPVNPVEVGFFDTTPYGKDVAGFDGTWSSYPYFKSGMIVVTSRREGLFILKKRDVDL